MFCLVDICICTYIHACVHTYIHAFMDPKRYPTVQPTTVLAWEIQVSLFTGEGFPELLEVALGGRDQSGYLGKGSVALPG